MSEDLGGVLVGGLVALAGGGGVTWLTSWLSGRASSVERDRSQKEQQRAHVVEVVDAGRDWAKGITTLALALASPMPADDLMESEHWSSHDTSVARYRRALTAAELVLVDEVLYQKARRLADHVAEQVTVMEPLSVGKIRGTKATRAQYDAVTSFVQAHESLLDDFVRLARTRLAG